MADSKLLLTPGSPDALLPLDELAHTPSGVKKTDYDGYPKDKELNILLPPSEDQDPPPEFAPYEAEFEYTSSGDVVSHDQHLNEDGEALYRFLLSQAQAPPNYALNMRGTHTERRTRRVSRTDSHGHTTWETESYTVTITDFAFAIDVGQHVVAGPTHWSVPDEVPAFRGEMFREVLVRGGVDTEGEQGDGKKRRGKRRDVESGGVDGWVRRKAEGEEEDAAEQWAQTRIARGYPPWVGPEVMNPGATQGNPGVLRSSKTVREWADEYCASNKVLKEFVYEKVIYGWDAATLSDAVTNAIRATPYSGDITVAFAYANRHIYIRPNNRLSRILESTCYKILLWLVLVYPFIWLWRRFSRRGGGRWEVCGSAYALKTWRVPERPLPRYDDTPGAEGSVAPVAPAPEVVGMREGEFFRMWEATIKRGVAARWKLDAPLVRPPGWNDAHVPGNPAYALDGYVPPTGPAY